MSLPATAVPGATPSAASPTAPDLAAVAEGFSVERSYIADGPDWLAAQGSENVDELEAALGGDVRVQACNGSRLERRTIRPSAMGSQKTLPSEESAEAFIAAVRGDARREDAQKLSGLLAEWTGEPPVMWGPSIVGFGSYRYRYDSGHEGTAALVGFAPRKENLVLYVVGGVQDRYPELLQQLGPHKVGKGCLYFKRLDDVNLEVLRKLVDRTVRVHRGADRRASAGT